nr:PAAR domain-containing protein [uncultured Capnocytophaga sp.]
MSTGILGWFFGKGPNKAFNKGVEKVANHHSHKSFGQLFEEATEELGNLQAGLAKAITPFSVSLPAAKYLDLGIGVDLHSTVAPPSPMMPVPNTIMVFDIIGAIFGGIAMLVPDPPPPPPPAEGEEPAPSPITLASVGRTIVDMMRPTVKVNGRWIANAGTSIQHLPAIFFHLAPSVAPMAEGEVYMGSSTVVADGAPFTYQYNAYGNRTAMESSLGAKLQHTYNEWGEWVMFQMCC